MVGERPGLGGQVCPRMDCIYTNLWPFHVEHSFLKDGMGFSWVFYSQIEKNLDRWMAIDLKNSGVQQMSSIDLTDPPLLN